MTSQWQILLPEGPAKPSRHSIPEVLRGMAGSWRAQHQAGVHRAEQGCWVRGLLVLCLCTLPSAATLGAECGTWFSLTPTGLEQELDPAGSFPWMVSLQGLHGGHVAFGAILSKRWVVTAASSIYDRSQLLALVGAAGLKVPISTLVPHEAFDEITLVHNIALLKTRAPIHFSETVRPVCFPYETFPPAALENCLVVGSQHPHTGGSSLWTLRVEDVDPCPLHRIMTTECCSHREGDSVPGCLGYPGNPVVCQAKETGQWLLKGILTEGGARCYGPFLYTKVSDYSEWIVSTTAQRGPPASPISGRRGFAVQTPVEHRKGVAEPPLEEMALDSSDEQAGLNWTQESKESSQELPEGPEGRSNPVYYDYYAGELVPVSAATLRPPGGLCGAISAGLFLLGLTGWGRN